MLSPHHLVLCDGLEYLAGDEFFELAVASLYRFRVFKGWDRLGLFLLIDNFHTEKALFVTKHLVAFFAERNFNFLKLYWDFFVFKSI